MKQLLRNPDKQINEKKKENYIPCETPKRMTCIFPCGLRYFSPIIAATNHLRFPDLLPPLFLHACYKSSGFVRPLITLNVHSTLCAPSRGTTSANKHRDHEKDTAGKRPNALSFPVHLRDVHQRNPASNVFKVPVEWRMHLANVMSRPRELLRKFFYCSLASFMAQSRSTDTDRRGN